MGAAGGASDGRPGSSRRRAVPTLLAAPISDARVIAGGQHLRDTPATELSRSRVVRVLESSAELDGEALLVSGALAQRTRQPPRDSVEHDHRRQLAAGEHVWADRDGVVREVREDALVDDLEPSGQERQEML